MYAETKVSPMP